MEEGKGRTTGLVTINYSLDKTSRHVESRLQSEKLSMQVSKTGSGGRVNEEVK